MLKDLFWNAIWIQFELLQKEMIILLSSFSMVEIIQGGASGLSVLRTFRLLRILKLVRFMPALRRQLFVMLKTMDNVATFFALLVLFIFIFRWAALSKNAVSCGAFYGESVFDLGRIFRSFLRLNWRNGIFQTRFWLRGNLVPKYHIVRCSFFCCMTNYFQSGTCNLLSRDNKSCVRCQLCTKRT